MTHTHLDLKKLLCPLPVIKVQNHAKDCKAGDTIEVVCTDPGVLHDIPTWCRMYGHEVVKQSEGDGEIVMVIEIGA